MYSGCEYGDNYRKSDRARPPPEAPPDAGAAQHSSPPLRDASPSIQNQRDDPRNRQPLPRLADPRQPRGNRVHARSPLPRPRPLLREAIHLVNQRHRRPRKTSHARTIGLPPRRQQAQVRLRRPHRQLAGAPGRHPPLVRERRRSAPPARAVEPSGAPGARNESRPAGRRRSGGRTRPFVNNSTQWNCSGTATKRAPGARSRTPGAPGARNESRPAGRRRRPTERTSEGAPFSLGAFSSGGRTRPFVKNSTQWNCSGNGDEARPRRAQSNPRRPRRP